MSPWSDELRRTLRLAGPIVAAQLGQMGLGVVDTLMVGSYSSRALAGIALGHVCFWGLTGFGYRILTALDPLVSQAIGRGDRSELRFAVQRGIALACALTLPLVALGLLVGPFLELLRQPPDAREAATAYVYWSLPGILPFLLHVALRQSLQALSRVRPILLTLVVANAFNVLANWCLIHGKLGFPELGLVGSAIASGLSRVILFGGLLAMAWPLLGPLLRPFDRRAGSRMALAPMLWLGLPIGAQFLLEMGAFSMTTLAMGWIGATEIAGHQTALLLASTSFMVPVGISSAAAVRVGYAVGAGDPPGVRRAALAALLLGGSTMAGFAVLFLAAPRSVAGLVTDLPEPLAIAAVLVPIAGVFQVFDGIQVVCIGILRGMGDTRSPLAVNLVGFWVLGLPLGMALAFGAGIGPAGLWWGLTLGLAAVAATLSMRILGKVQVSAPPTTD